MNPTRPVLRATLVLAALLVASCFVPDPARAIQLRWSTGTTDLTVSQNTQAVLVLQADSAEVLPSSWTFQWTADSLGLSFSTLEPALACLVDTAKVDSIALPSTPADSAANLVTAYFCSYGSTNAASAQFLVDVPAGGHGKLRVVAISPADTTRVIKSNEATYNGGVGGTYWPAILGIKSGHSTTVLTVEAIGANLDAVQGVSISAPELGSDIPLALTVRTDSVLVASADISISLPACKILFRTSEFEIPFGEVPEDHALMTTLPYRWVFRDTSESFSVYPKDFALIDAPLLVSGQWQRVYHLYYIRHYKDGRARNEYALGHAWSRDLEHWNYNPFALVADTLHSTNWDGAHVWAPSILRFKASNNRDTCIMFYTGVDNANNQTIGYASASAIDTIDAPGHWTRRSTATLTPLNAQDWVKQAQPWDFRDPFVMADPESPTQHLLFYAARMKDDPAHLAVGVFQSQPGTLDGWINLGHYAVTEHSANGDSTLESPHVFPDSSHSNPLQSNNATWRLMYTDGDWTDLHKAVLFNTKTIGASLTETQAGSWTSTPVGLGNYLNFTTNSPEYGVQATEVLQIGGTYFWAGYNGDELVFRKLRWGTPSATDFALIDINFLAVDQPDLPRATELRLADFRLGQATVRFRADLPAAMRADIAIYDVMGRRVRALADRNFSAGATEITWDGRDRSGVAVSSGIYFARMRAGGVSYVVRVPLVR